MFTFETDKNSKPSDYATLMKERKSEHLCDS